jgi:hypothetical protein
MTDEPRSRRPSSKLVAVHVGAHKTGTTVVQQYLRSHVRHLARQRVRYVGRTQLTPCVGWGERLVEHPDAVAALLAGFARNPWYRTLIASHENIVGHPFVPGRPGLYPAAGPMLESLHGVLGGYRHKIVISVRPQHELIESYYLQSVKLGRTTPFRRWLTGIDLDALSWRPLVARLDATFGAEAVEIIDFRLIRQGGQQYVRHFLGRIDPRIRVDPLWERSANPSLSAQGLQIALAANRQAATLQDRAALRKHVQRHYSNRTQPRPVLLGESLTRELEQRYADDYAGLFSIASPGSPARHAG